MKKIVMALVILSSFVLTEIVLYSQNTLVQHSDWRVGKKELQVGVMGADPFLITRPALAQNVLHLGTWYGFNEITYAKKLRAQKISFRFNLEEDSYINLIVGRSNNHDAIGIRLSRNRSHPSVFFTLSPLGEFVTKTLLSAEIDSAWHSASVHFLNTYAVVELDGFEIGRLSLNSDLLGYTSFRSGLHPSKIDDISITEISGIRYQTSFRNNKNYVELITLNFFLIILIIGIFFGLKLVRKNKDTNVYANLLVFFVALCSCASIYFYFDFRYWSNLEFQNLTRPIATEKKQQNPSAIEQARHVFTSAWYKVAWGKTVSSATVFNLKYRSDRIFAGPILCENENPCAAVQNYSPEKGKKRAANEIRVMFIGTSQTVGAGASELNLTFAAKIHQNIVKNIVSSKRTVSLNISKSGSTSSELFNDYFQLYSSFKPNIIIINLGNNDSPEELSRTLPSFLDFCRKNSIKIALIQEPNTSELKYFNLEKHNIIKKIGDQYGISVINAHSFFQSELVKDSGLLWWDRVHLADFGHQAFAKWLTPLVLMIIKNQISFVAK